MMKTYFKVLLCAAVTSFVPLPSPALGNQQAIKLNNQAMELDRQGQGKDAIGLFNQALAVDPTNQAILRNRCLVLRDIGETEAAMRDIAELLTRSPHSPEFMLIRGSLYFRKGERDKGVKDFNQALEQEPDNPEFLQMYQSYMRYLDPGSFHYLSLRRLGRQDWTWDGQAENADLALPVRQMGFHWSSTEAEQALSPLAGEMRLHGRITGQNPSKGTMQVEVVAFGAPSGRVKALGATKIKQVLAANSEVDLGAAGKVPLGALQPGRFVLLVGKDKPAGFEPRRCFTILDQRPWQDLKKLLQSEDLSPNSTLASFPQIPSEAVGRPPLQENRAASRAAHYVSFLAQDEMGPILFTPAAGLDLGQPTPQKDDLLPRIRTAVAKLPTQLNWLKNQELNVSSRHLGTGSFLDRQVLALRVTGTPAALPLAKTSPVRGDRVWTSGQGQSGHTSCVVLAADANRLVLVANDPEGPSRRVGEAVLNGAGEVIGMVMTGTGDVTLAVPLEALRRTLQQGPVGAK